jgi:hypothetical protein
MFKYLGDSHAPEAKFLTTKEVEYYG